MQGKVGRYNPDWRAPRRRNSAKAVLRTMWQQYGKPDPRAWHSSAWISATRGPTVRRDSGASMCAVRPTPMRKPIMQGETGMRPAESTTLLLVAGAAVLGLGVSLIAIAIKVMGG